jgi:DNA-binding transcriptional LysR family regulator
MYRLARAGAGLAVVPEFLAEEDVAAGLVEYVLPSWALESIDVFATWPANAPRHGLIKLFINEICQKQSEHTMMSGSSG